MLCCLALDLLEHRHRAVDPSPVGKVTQRMPMYGEYQCINALVRVHLYRHCKKKRYSLYLRVLFYVQMRDWRPMQEVGA